MKTSAELQAQSVRRKLIYFAAIIVLFSLVTFSGSMTRALTGNIATWTISHQAEKLQLTETTQGHADVAGSTVRLALTGSRGFAVCFLWISAQEYQKRHEWNKLDVLVESITKLQPHFLTPWLFQSWNLTYNVSVESDRVRDKYFYITKGIQLLAEGELINRGRGADELGEFETGNPDMRYWIGFYYMNKFGSSDEQNTLRSLFQMSCMNPSKRMNLRVDGQVAPERFREFVKENPRLVRRLREKLRCNTPDDVVDFLVDNQNIPSRYERVDTRWHLKSISTDQFPVVPNSVWDSTKSGSSIDIGTLRGDVGDDYDNYRAGYWWMCFAQDPLPPHRPGIPARATAPEKPLRHRNPRSPALILFRQAPPRCLSYIAEYLQKEGWFDESGWVVDQGRSSAPWFRTTDGSPERMIVGADPRYSSMERWKNAYEQWTRHGNDHGFLLDQAKIDKLNNEAELYRKAYNAAPQSVTTELNRAQVSAEIWNSYDAHTQLVYFEQNQQMTNFKRFLYQAQAESDKRTIETRRLLYEADRERRLGNNEVAIRRFEAAFNRLRGNPAAGERGLLDEFSNFRNDTTTQEDLIEQQIEYVRLLNEHRGTYVRSSMMIGDALSHLAAQTSTSFNPAGFAGATVFQLVPNMRQMNLFVGPLDGNDSAGNPWLAEKNVFSVKMRLGLIQVPNTPPATPGPMPAMPQTPR